MAAPVQHTWKPETKPEAAPNIAPEVAPDAGGSENKGE
jgi:hypothetical protein